MYDELCTASKGDVAMLWKWHIHFLKYVIYGGAAAMK
jgi:hypothetical protein